MIKQNPVFIAVLTLIFCVSTALLQSQTGRPNIIYIMSDDHAYQAISAYGYGLNNTPNIDKLAREGMLFKKAFVTNSICGPSRAVMLTGKYSHINGFIDNATTFDNTQNTVAKELHNAGIKLQWWVNGIWYPIQKDLIIGIFYRGRVIIIIRILLRMV